MMYTAEPYGCPPAGLMLVPFPCMMDQNGHLIQFPCAMDQSQPLSWTPPSIPGNGFHMPYSQTCQEEINLVTPCTGASEKTSQDVAEDADESTADPALDCIPDDILALGNPQLDATSSYRVGPLSQWHAHHSKGSGSERK